MAANGVSRGRPGRTPQFLTLGLLVVICILAFNYWNVSSRSRLLQRQVHEMTASLEELAMKKVHLERRSEALQSQINDANKINTQLKSDREVCAQEREQINKGKDELVSQLSVMMREKETAISSLDQFRKNASQTIQLLMEMKTKYGSLHGELEQMQEASRLDGKRKDDKIQAIQLAEQQAYSQLQQCEQDKATLGAQLSQLHREMVQLQEAGRNEEQVSGQQKQAGNGVPAETANQNAFGQVQQQQQQIIQQIQQQQQQQLPQQQQQQQLTQQQQQPPQQQQPQQQYWMQRQQDYLRQQQEQQQQQQQNPQGQVPFDQQEYLRQQQQQQEQLQQNIEDGEQKPQEGDQIGQQDPGPVQMEANADNKPPGDQQAPNMFIDREEAEPQQQEGEHHDGQGLEQRGPGGEEGGVVDIRGEGNNLDEGPEQDQGQQGVNEEEEEEESELSDVDNEQLDEEDNDRDQGQVQAPGPGQDEERVDENGAKEPSSAEDYRNGGDEQEIFPQYADVFPAGNEIRPVVDDKENANDFGNDEDYDEEDEDDVDYSEKEESEVDEEDEMEAELVEEGSISDEDKPLPESSLNVNEEDNELADELKLEAEGEAEEQEDYDEEEEEEEDYDEEEEEDDYMEEDEEYDPELSEPGIQESNGEDNPNEGPAYQNGGLRVVDENNGLDEGQVGEGNIGLQRPNFEGGLH